jgi:hypothetical protein
MKTLHNCVLNAAPHFRQSSRQPKELSHWKHPVQISPD